MVNYNQHDGQTYLVTEENSSGTEFLSAEIMEPAKKKDNIHGLYIDEQEGPHEHQRVELKHV